MTTHLLRGGDPALLADAVAEAVHTLVGEEDRALVVDDLADEAYEVARIVEAARTPPFLTSRRVVVACHVEQFTRQEQVAPLIEYLGDPLETTELVLVAGGTAHKALVEAVRSAGGTIVDTDPGRAAKEWTNAQFAAAAVKLEPGARDLIADRLGEDLGRLPALLDGLEATYGPGARLGEVEVEPFLGDAGGVPSWELTDAIDRGDTAGALDRLARMVGGGTRHPLQVLATLSGHYSRILRLSGSDAADERAAAALLGLRGSTFPARKALDQGRRLGPHGVARAFELLAGADLDVRGASSGPMSCCSRFSSPGCRAWCRQRAGGQLGLRRPALGLVGGQPLHEARLAPSGLVLVDHTFGGGLVEPLLSGERGVGRVLACAPDGDCRLHAGLELGAHGLVAVGSLRVLDDALLLALDVGHDDPSD